MKKLTSGILTMMLLLMALAFVITGVPMVFDTPQAYAELSKSKMLGLSGVNYSSNLGNATGAYEGFRVGGSAEVPDEFNCFFTVTNASGVGVANNATAVLETSINNVDYDTFRTVTVSNSTVTGAYNTPGSTTPMGNYWRVNITAIQNANDSYVRSRCLFE